RSSGKSDKKKSSQDRKDGTDTTGL
ncbi:molybdopterin-guanine dinucleotide biosynthesis protein MobC, partial [Salmonella enterica]|nr:molybdopterin-guanine dinucleotide biosynthesis protein MobC [Salmonella enterica]